MARRSGRKKPVGWRNHSDEHALASRGIKTRYKDKIDRRTEAERREEIKERMIDIELEIFEFENEIQNDVSLNMSKCVMDELCNARMSMQRAQYEFEDVE